MFAISLLDDSVSELLVHSSILEFVVFVRSKTAPPRPDLIGDEQRTEEDAGSWQGLCLHPSSTTTWCSGCKERTSTSSDKRGGDDAPETSLGMVNTELISIGEHLFVGLNERRLLLTNLVSVVELVLMKRIHIMHGSRVLNSPPVAEIARSPVLVHF